jgi:RES domain-containing protein
MRVWRIARLAYPPLDGEGARLNGARWNSPGTAVVYTAGSLALAIVELLVHTDPDLIPDDLTAFEIEVPSGVSLQILQANELPVGWDDPDDLAAARSAGDDWLRAARSCVLAVPSVIVPEETNYLINPAHPDASAISVLSSRPFSFDPRLIR